MSDQQHTGPGATHEDVTTREAAHAGTDGARPVATTDSQTHTGAELEQRYANPGLAPHLYRRADIDPQAAKRREREVAALFGLSTLGTLIFIFGYFFFKLADHEGEDLLQQLQYSNLTLGIGLSLALLGIGLGAVHWAKTLMPDDEVVQERKPMRSSDERREAAVEALKEGAGGAGLGRRKLIRNSLLGALAPLGLLALVPLRDLGPLPGASLTGTAWKRGKRLVTDPTGHPLKPGDVPIGGVIHVQPEGIDEMPQPLNAKAKATTIVIRLPPGVNNPAPGREDWEVAGIVAYSKVCTHVGCPVGLYEQQTRHLLCPCHQSTFDVPNHCAVVFGPAARPLPQLPLGVDEEGYLISKSDFVEPVGPSFWERGEN